MAIKNANLSLYNSKYLKYKNKYLSLKKMFGGTKEKINVIAVLPNGRERAISFLEEEELVPAMARELGFRPTQIIVSFMDKIVNMGLTAKDCAIGNDSRLTFAFHPETIKIGMHFYNTLEEYYIAYNEGRNPNNYPTLSNFDEAKIDMVMGLSSSDKYRGYRFNFELFKNNRDTDLAHIYKLIISPIDIKNWWLYLRK